MIAETNGKFIIAYKSWKSIASIKPINTLQVEVDNLLTAIAVWSVTRQFTTGRKELVHWLYQCWRMHFS